MKTNAERLFQMHFTKLVEIMKKMIEDGNSVVKIWTDNISNLPFCFLADLEEDDVLDGIIFRGIIQPWSDEVEDLMPEEQKVRHTAGFIFKHKNIAHFVYVPVGNPIDEQECIEGTWDEIVSLMIKFINISVCDIPEMPRHIKDLFLKN